jgi:hypothetical protein
MKVRKEAEQMRLKGATLTAISKALGRSKTTVYYWIKTLPKPKRFTKAAVVERRRQREESLARRRAEREEKIRNARLISGDGRWMVRAPDGYEGTTYIKGRYVYEHRLLVERKIGRLLESDEHVHHINGDKLDNRLSNLEIISPSEHTRLHALERARKRWRVPER